MEFSGVCCNERTMEDCPSKKGLFFRPKGALARAMLRKQQHDQCLQNFNKSAWYECELAKLSPDLIAKFVQLGPDQDTVDFLQQSEEKSEWLFLQLWHSLIKGLFGWFFTQTTINGWLKRGSMFVLSQQQFEKLYPERNDEEDAAKSLLDLGAGDGEVTARLAARFQEVFVTEVSTTMRSLLVKRGYKLLEINDWHHKKYDVISCLNLLDRCDSPLDILQKIQHSLKPQGRVILALVLPFSPYVESGSRDHMPRELLPIQGTCFEEQVQSIVLDVLQSNFEVESWSRVPYLCEGDLEQSYYWLDDVVFVLRAKN